MYNNCIPKAVNTVQIRKTNQVYFESIFLVTAQHGAGVTIEEDVLCLFVFKC